MHAQRAGMVHRCHSVFELAAARATDINWQISYEQIRVRGVAVNDEPSGNVSKLVSGPMVCKPREPW
jgi:hypothetical protein